MRDSLAAASVPDPDKGVGESRGSATYSKITAAAF